VLGINPHTDAATSDLSCRLHGMLGAPTREYVAYLCAAEGGLDTTSDKGHDVGGVVQQREGNTEKCWSKANERGRPDAPRYPKTNASSSAACDSRYPSGTSTPGAAGMRGCGACLPRRLNASVEVSRGA
jgi:hypothetical protein